MEAYKKKLVKRVRAYGSRLNALSDEEIIKLIERELDRSDSCLYPGFEDVRDEYIQGFIVWATTAPCDRIRKGRA